MSKKSGCQRAKTCFDPLRAAPPLCDRGRFSRNGLSEVDFACWRRKRWSKSRGKMSSISVDVAHFVCVAFFYKNCLTDCFVQKWLYLHLQFKFEFCKTEVVFRVLGCLKWTSSVDVANADPNLAGKCCPSLLTSHISCLVCCVQFDRSIGLLFVLLQKWLYGHLLLWFEFDRLAVRIGLPLGRGGSRGKN